MWKNFRYILHSFAPNYLWEGLFALVILGFCTVSGTVKFARMGIIYFNLFPGILLFTMLLVGNAFTSSGLNHALSYGARRSDYYLGLLLFTAFNTLIFWASDILFSLIPVWLGWQGEFAPPSFSPMFPVLSVTALSLGCALGPFVARSHWFGGVIGGLCGGLMAGTTTYNTLNGTIVWHDFSWWLFLTCLFVTLLCQLKTRSIIVNATVR